MSTEFRPGRNGSLAETVHLSGATADQLFALLNLHRSFEGEIPAEELRVRIRNARAQSPKFPGRDGFYTRRLFTNLEEVCDLAEQRGVTVVWV